MKLFVVIAVFNRKHYTLQCLQLLKKQSYTDFQIVIVDDGSTDGTSLEIKESFPDVIIVEGTGNWWWTKSMHVGCKTAIANNAKLIITLNNDTFFDIDFLEKLVQLHIENPKAIIGSLNTIKKDQEYIFFSGIKNIVWWKAKEVKYHKAFTVMQKGLNGLYPTKCLNGRGTLIPVSIYNKTGGYDIGFPQYASDYDLALRVQEAGFKCLISYDVIVRSYIEETGEGKSFVKQSSISFFKSFLNPYSQTSLKMWFRYYKAHAPKYVFVLGFIMQQFRAIFAFYKKRNLLNKL